MYFFLELVKLATGAKQQEAHTKHMSYSYRPNDYLTTAEASKYLNVTRFTVLNWIKSGKLQSASTFGGHSRIPRGVLQAALKQVTTTNRSTTITTPIPKESNSTVHCWESKEVAASKCGHNCTKCLIFKKKVDVCFLSVKEYGSLKVECKQDCMSCTYLSNQHPQDRKILARQRAKVAKEFKRREVLSSGVNGILKKVFYNSGRFVAKIGQLSKGTESTRRHKRANKKARKG